MSRHIALAIDPLSEEADKTIQWAIDNFFRPTDQIHAVMILILDVEFTDEFGKSRLLKNNHNSYSLVNRITRDTYY